MNEVKKSNIRPTTYDFYEYLIRVHIKPELGSYQLKILGQSPEVLQTFYNKKRTEKKLGKKKDDRGNYLPSDEVLSTRTIRGMQIVIDMALKKAVQLHKIPENPNAVLDKVKYKRPKVKYLTSMQVIDFLEGISTDRWYPAIVTDLGSGLRVGELVALKWKEHIDLDRESFGWKELFLKSILIKKRVPKQFANSMTPKVKRENESSRYPKTLLKYYAIGKSNRKKKN